MRIPILSADPFGVTTLTGPVVAIADTVAVITVADNTRNPVAAVPLNLTAVAPARFVPVIVTVVPGEPEDGVNDVIAGMWETVKLAALVAVPPAVVMLILPVVASVGTVAVTEFADTTLNVVASIPLNVTSVAPNRLVPVMVTDVPDGPEVGVNEDIVGAEVFRVPR